MSIGNQSPKLVSDLFEALWAYQQAHSLTDYDLAAMAGGVSRDTIGRWRRHPIALGRKTIEHLLDAIEERADSAGAAREDLRYQLLAARQALATAANAPRERVRRHLDAKGHRGRAVVAEIEAAGYQVVPRDGA